MQPLHNSASIFGAALAAFDPAPVTFWTPYPKQQAAMDLSEECFELLFGGSAGPGKGGRTPDRTAADYDPATETRVMTPKGWRLFGDIKVGDVVSNPDGTTATVIKVTDNGPKQFYRVTLNDGSSVEADEEHLWAVSIAGDRKRGKIAPPFIPPGLRSEDEWNLRVQSRATIVNTVELARLVARADDEKARGLRPHYAQVPLTNPVAMTGVGTQWKTFSPYTLGALVGDGILDGSVAICGIDDEVFDRVRAELPPGIIMRPRPGSCRDDGFMVYGFVREGIGDTGDVGSESFRDEPFARRLRELRVERGLGQRELAALIDTQQVVIGKIERGEVWPRRKSMERLDEALKADGELLALWRPRDRDTATAILTRDGLAGHKAWDKFIPDRIKRAPVADRLAFVQGLMDTDGSIDTRGHCEYVTVSERLAKDMQEILRSLGYRAVLNTKTTTYTYGGEKKVGRLAYKLYIQGRSLVDLFHISRKRDRARAGFNGNGGDVEPWHRVVSVVPTVVDNSRCITVDNLNHLYLTDDYIVTHNSHALRGHACDFAYNNPGAHIGIVRRTLPMLKQTHGLHLPAMLRGHARENRTDFTFTFPNRSVIRFISLQHPGDEQAYKSAEFDCLLFDELTEFEESQYTFMLSRVRSARGHRTHVIATSNPEGRGFRWVKRRFVDPRPEDLAEGQDKPKPGEVWAPPIVESGTVIGWHPKRAFMPATVRDNPGLMKSNPGYVQQLMALPDSRLRRALVDGDWTAMDAIPGALWSQSSIDDNRVESIPCDLTRVVVGVDPSGSSANGDRECGIVVVGLGADGNCYVLDDVSGAMTPDEWARAAASAYRRHNADRVVAERNFGGEMVLSTLEHAEPNLPVELVNASRGKAVRAEPVAVLTTRGRVKFVGRFPELEDQLTTWTPSDKWSPDRLDAFTWSTVQLMGGAAALAFLSALSAKCPECKTINTAGHPVCFQCGADLPFAQEGTAAVVPPGQALTDATPDTPDEADGDIPSDPGPVVPPGATVIAGLILP